MKKPKEKKPRRNQVKNAALKKRYNSRILGEYIDYDYLDQLGDEELAWLNKFTEEFHKASYKRDGTDIQDYNKVIGKNEDGDDITYGKDSNDRNNAQNRCQYGHLKNKADRNNNKKLLNYEALVNGSDTSKSLEIEYPVGHNPSTIEDAYVDFLEDKEMQELEAFAVELDALEDHAEHLDKINEIASEDPELPQQLTPKPQEP